MSLLHLLDTRPRLAIDAPRLLRLQLAWSVLVLGAWALFLGFSPLDDDYASGELLDHYLAWGERGTLYAPVDQSPYRVLNYPPLIFSLVQAVASLGLAPLAAGRLVNLLAMAASLGLVFLWLRRAGARPREALFSLGILGSSVAVVYLAGQFHLQWVAVLLSLAGLFLVAGGRGQAPAALAGALCALACFAKQTQVVSALIALLWLLRYQRGRSLSFGLGFLAMAGLGASTASFMFGPELWRHLVLYTVGTYTWSLLGWQLLGSVVPWILLVAAAVALGARSREGRADLRWWYFCGSSVALLSSARSGSSYQYFIEWSLALILWLGPQLGAWVTRPWVVALLALQLLAADVYQASQLVLMGRHLVSNQVLLARLGPWLPEPSGLICTDEPGLARASGRQPALQPFIISNLARRGLFDERQVVRELEQSRYPLVLMPFSVAEDRWGRSQEFDRWTPAMLEAMHVHYRTVRLMDGWEVMRPRSPR